jgi:hypothetical protein
MGNMHLYSFVVQVTIPPVEQIIQMIKVVYILEKILWEEDIF